jgi:SAM-dependent methyltransferase
VINEGNILKESDIRPRDLFEKYLELSAKDAITYFGSSTRTDLPCPACGNNLVQPAFEKHGFDYKICRTCGTLYQSPRPPWEDFARFYKESPSAQYWARIFFPAVAESRRVHLFRPKVQELAQLCQKDQFFPKVFADIGAGYGLLLEEWRRSFPDTKLFAVEPNPDLAAQCRLKNLHVVELFAEEANQLHNQVDLVTAFEIIEHSYDPLAFLNSLAKLLRTGGRILITGLTIDGFDIQVLWQRSNNISPPHHINLISIEGFEFLLARAGFSNIHIFTPGKLDVDILKNALRYDKDILSGQRFLQTLFTRGEETLGAFQKFLSDHRLSSHCWVWASK